MSKKIFEYLNEERVFDDKMNYEQFRNITGDLVKGRFDENEKKIAEEAVYEYVLKIFNLEKEDLSDNRKVKKAINRYSKAFMEVVEHTIMDAILQGFINPFFMDYVEQLSVRDGDRPEWVVEDDNQLLAVAKVSGGHHDFLLQQLGAFQTFTANPIRYGVAVGADIRLYVLGRIDFSYLVGKIYESMEKNMIDVINAELATMANKMPTNALLTLTAPFDDTNKEKIDELIQNVDILSGNNGVVIYGTALGLKNFRKLDDIEWRSSDAKNELYHTGRLGLYEGTPLVEIKQNGRLVGQNNVEKLIDDDVIYVFPRSAERFIKLVMWGDAEVYSEQNIGDRFDDTMKMEYTQSFAVLTIITKAMGVITVNNS